METGLKVYKNEEWVEALVGDCKAIITEAVFTSRWALVEGYWKLGERIVMDTDYQKYSHKNRILSHVTKLIGQSERTIHRSIQFYNKYPDLQKVPEGKNISWHKICNKYLPEHTAKEEEFNEEIGLEHKCPKCGYEW